MDIVDLDTPKKTPPRAPVAGWPQAAYFRDDRVNEPVKTLTKGHGYSQDKYASNVTAGSSTYMYNGCAAHWLLVQTLYVITGLAITCTYSCDLHVALLVNADLP